MADRHSVLSLRDVVLAERRTARSGHLNLELGHGEAAVLEVGEEADMDQFVDLCLGLTDPVSGDVVCMDTLWRDQSYADALARRATIGTLAGTLAWPVHVSVAEAVMTPSLHHGGDELAQLTVRAALLARRFGLPGLPVGNREAVAMGQLVRAACIRAFLGKPDFVLIADPTLERMAELALPLAHAIREVQDRGGAVLWIVESIGAPAARYVMPQHALRYGDRGLVSLQRAA